MKTYKGNPFDKPQNGNDFIADVSKTFYCANEKKWLDKCKEQCMSCSVETIRTKAQ